MKSLMWLVRCMLTDVGIRCCTDTSRDIKYISRRVEHEGESFLTITLPEFGKDFERSLDSGQVDSKMFLGFHGPRRHSALPAFLQGLTSRVFDKSGKLLDDVDVEAVRCIRQVVLMWKKLHLPCSMERIDATFRRFVECDSEVPTCLAEFDPARLEQFGRVSAVLWRNVLYATEQSVANGTILPKHGPGATAERISGNGKYVFREWTTRLERAFPFTGYGLASLSQLDEEPLEEVTFREPEDERPVRVITVPKTLKAPRIIAIEPVCMQYTQQALLESLVDSIESHELTRGSVNFTDQTINRSLALQGSADGSIATIDLSEASDRVALVLVDRMLEFSGCGYTHDAILACRSTRADVPGHGVIQLNKFASMGSALCFPVEAMVFFTIAVSAILESLSLPVTYLNIRKVAREVRVYGDDIIVPVDKVQVVIDWLEGFSLKVNARKSFWTGRFRESCGMDAYDGIQVTPVYLTRMPPDDKRSHAEIVSFVSFANNLYKEGYWHTAKEVRHWIEDLIGQLPSVLDTSPALGWTCFDNRAFTFHKVCPSLQKPLVRSWVASVRKDEDGLDGYPALLKFFLQRGKHREAAMDLQKSVLSGRVNIKRRWSTPY
jgi:hypothetical protein